MLRHSHITDNGIKAKHFLENERRVQKFTSFTSEELLSFARHKIKMAIEEIEETGSRKRFRVGTRGVDNGE